MTAPAGRGYFPPARGSDRAPPGRGVREEPAAPRLPPRPERVIEELRRALVRYWSDTPHAGRQRALPRADAAAWAEVVPPGQELAHAEAVATLAGRLVTASPASGTTAASDDLSAVTAAALLHNVTAGPSGERETLLRSALASAGGSGPQAARVLHLTASVHATAAAFPSESADGAATPVPGSRPVAPALPSPALVYDPSRSSSVGREGSDAPGHSEARLVVALREADARAHAGPGALEAAERAWARRLDPVAAPSGGLLPWRWGVSVAANLRLLARRAAVDCVSPDGIDEATRAHERVEQAIRHICESAGVPYEPPVAGPAERAAALARLTAAWQAGAGDASPELVDAGDWSELVSTLRAVPLTKVANVRPYAAARLVSRVLRLDQVRPTSLYALEDNLARAARLHDDLVVHYAGTPFDLPGVVTLRLPGAGEVRVAPPIVDVLPEDAAPGAAAPLGLVDGLHRVLAAFVLDLPVRCLVAEGATAPLVPLLAAWDEVRKFPSGTRPADENQKRRYRFQARAELPLDAHPYAAVATDADARYFFFRDFGALGSAGVRPLGGAAD